MTDVTTDADGSPRLFLSYSWTSVDHQAWVLNLAERLVHDGVHVILDKWDLQPGHDAYAFMEQMVTDPTVTKVLMVSDSGYADKADGRKGGVGTESQIITPALYGKAARDKFAAAVTETTDEGQSTLPVFARSRIYFDFSSPEREEIGYDQLLRWTHNKPQHVRPKLGDIPRHIGDPSATVLSTESQAKRLEDAIKNDLPNAAPLFRDYLEQIHEALLGHGITVGQARTLGRACSCISRGNASLLAPVSASDTNCPAVHTYRKADGRLARFHGEGRKPHGPARGR